MVYFVVFLTYKGKNDSKIIPLEHRFPRKLLNFALKSEV